jgi:hypothetical protein
MHRTNQGHPRLSAETAERGLALGYIFFRGLHPAAKFEHDLNIVRVFRSVLVVFSGRRNLPSAVVSGFNMRSLMFDFLRLAPRLGSMKPVVRASVST